MHRAAFMVSSNKYLVNLLALLRKYVPKILIIFIERIRVLPMYLGWLIDRKFGKKFLLKTISPLKNNFSGKRCIIIGNGPSLNKIDLQLLKNEYTFGLNRIYLLFEKIGFETTFLVSINRYVIKQFSSEMLKNDCIKFFNYKYRSYVSSKNTVNFIPPTIHSIEDFDNIEKGFLAYSGSVTFLAIQIALYLGFSEIILVGFDNKFNNQGSSDKAIKSKKNDSDHFDPNYFGKGIIWQLPNYDSLDYGFKVVENYFKINKDRFIVNCTVGGELHNFKRAELASHLKLSSFSNKVS